MNKIILRVSYTPMGNNRIDVEVNGCWLGDIIGPRVEVDAVLAQMRRDDTAEPNTLEVLDSR